MNILKRIKWRTTYEKSVKSINSIKSNAFVNLVQNLISLAWLFQMLQPINSQQINMSIKLIVIFGAVVGFSSFRIPAADANESLYGHLQSCLNEGEEVELEGIQNSKCFKCVCQNGFVNCDKDGCPSIDDCYLLEPKTADNCCQQCKGCFFHGVLYPSGAEWTDLNDPCKLYKCIANVVTESTIKCYTQCDESQIRPPKPNECCATCQGCKINAQLIAEGQEAVASIDDRCLICQCRENRLTCAKKTCPILQCPVTKQKYYPNECCPRCTEHRILMPVSGKCIFNNKVYFEHTQFMPDRCSNCTCINGTSVCQRITCPILECGKEYQKSDGCCAQCIIAEVRSECRHNDVSYANNATWSLGACRSCRCTAGNIRCSEMRCPEVRCRVNEELKVVEGECCPRCIETAGICTVFGDPHFKTYDGKFYSFQGPCKYLLTADCNAHDFSIRLTNDARGSRRSAWAKTITVKLHNTRITLGQKLRIKVNGTRVVMPYKSDNINVTLMESNAVWLQTTQGINVEWDGKSFLQVSVPAKYKRRLCGLCGNYNGLARDDVTARNGQNYSGSDVWRFANSWKVGGPKACSRKGLPNLQANCKQRKWSAHCLPLKKSAIFGNCDNRLNPYNYFESCKMDMCECTTDNCHCDALEAYAHECKRLGVSIPNDWQSLTNCSKLEYKTLAREKFYTLNNVKTKKNLLLERDDYMTKHVPKNLLKNHTPPPLH